jgi:glutamate 5-kinase
MYIKKYQNIVIKIGSSTLIHLSQHNLFSNFILDITKAIQFCNITIVTSGAIATARTILNLPKPTETSQKQALSSIGQPYLIQSYINEFDKYNIKVGQILLTKNDISNSQSLENLQSTIKSLRTINAIPIINENDAISTDEIKVGDNDTLACHIAIATKADALIILTDVNGIYDTNPNANPNAKLITHTQFITIPSNQNETSTEFGSGGIETKIKAGNLAIEHNIETIITNGRTPQPITSITENYCTIFTKITK